MVISLWIIISGVLCGFGVTGIIAFSLEKKRHIAITSSNAQCNTSFVFSGNLKQTTLLDAIQFLEIGRREGILHVYHGRRKGYLTFCKGQVIDSFYRNEIGREAVFLMLSLEEGDFYFEPKEITQPKLISDSIMDITFEWDERKNGV